MSSSPVSPISSSSSSVPGKFYEIRGERKKEIEKRDGERERGREGKREEENEKDGGISGRKERRGGRGGRKEGKR